MSGDETVDVGDVFGNRHLDGRLPCLVCGAMNRCEHDKRATVAPKGYEVVTVGDYTYERCLRCGARFMVGPSNFARTDHTRHHAEDDVTHVEVSDVRD